MILSVLDMSKCKICLFKYKLCDGVNRPDSHEEEYEEGEGILKLYHSP